MGVALGRPGGAGAVGTGILAGRQASSECDLHRAREHERLEARQPDDGARGADRPEQIDWASYLRFGAMIATSTAVMYALTYTNVFAFEHVRWSEERLYMSVIMGSAMAIVMLLFMWRMYKSRVVNAGILIGALVIGGIAFGLSQSQALVDDVASMDGIIPHHFIAILTSRRADIRDRRVRELADGIIDAQVREIAEMERLIADIKAKGPLTAAGH